MKHSTPRAMSRPMPCIAPGIVPRIRRHQRGSTIVEIALVAPVFFMLILGVFETGLLLRDDLTLSDAAQSGARALSVGADQPNADFMALRAVEHSMSTWSLDALDFVVVYRATGPEDSVPEACLQGPVPDLCNYYRPVDFELPFLGADDTPSSYWGCGPTAADAYLCPGSRPASIKHTEPLGSPFNDGPAYIGIYLRARHDVITNLLGDTITITEDQVVSVEPRRR